MNGGASADGTRVQIWTCNGTAAQRFTFRTDGTIVLTSAGKCVSVTSAGTANGTTTQLLTCNGTGAQRWSTR
ncbi:ricin-type beta-trefoil lectin domain protein [Micromonospora zamorensis]|uniref:ricin-type beta-trefoil lectin domain protein n=1 Tax=Micromonospora zamorensis TaxID=709883 RepID=UPI0037129AE3